MMRKSLLGMLLLLTLVLAGIRLQAHYTEYMDYPVPVPLVQSYLIPAGSSFTAMLEDLHELGIITKPGYFYFAAWWGGAATRIQAGEYLLSGEMTPREILQLFTSGKVVQHSLTIIEGWRFTELVQAVAKKKSTLRKTLPDYEEETILQQLGLGSYESAEGLFLADTWYFQLGDTDVEILTRAHEALMYHLQQLWHHRDTELPYDTPYDALTMASLVEKEVMLAEERTLVAGVFTRRLRKGMRLQTDPTVIYALGDQFDGRLRRQDLKVDSPYNTYRYAGFPPTPIAMVGKDSLQAVFAPAAGSSLYFVARGDGSHEFSDTLREHNRAVRKYILK